MSSNALAFLSGHDANSSRVLWKNCPSNIKYSCEGDVMKLKMWRFGVIRVIINLPSTRAGRKLQCNDRRGSKFSRTNERSECNVDLMFAGVPLSFLAVSDWCCDFPWSGMRPLHQWWFLLPNWKSRKYRFESGIVFRSLAGIMTCSKYLIVVKTAKYCLWTPLTERMKSISKPKSHWNKVQRIEACRLFFGWKIKANKSGSWTEKWKENSYHILGLFIPISESNLLGGYTMGSFCTLYDSSWEYFMQIARSCGRCGSFASKMPYTFRKRGTMRSA